LKKTLASSPELFRSRARAAHRRWIGARKTNLHSGAEAESAQPLLNARIEPPNSLVQISGGATKQFSPQSRWSSSRENEFSLDKSQARVLAFAHNCAKVGELKTRPHRCASLREEKQKGDRSHE
jgi:hypothetical protein